jgi:tRNA A-37 threonylcarbamoyl transferase component Bud32
MTAHADLPGAAARANDSARAEDWDGGPLNWRSVPEIRAFLESGQIDWLDLRPSDGIALVKRNAQRSVWRILAGGHDLFVKLYRPNGLAAKLKTAWRGPTAVQEWTVGHYAAEHGVPAVRPVACGWLTAERRTGPSWLITETVPDALPLAEYWLEYGHDPRHARVLIDVLARLIARAHQSGFHHRDMHANNILVRHAVTESPQAFFVDLHAVEIGKRVPTQTVLANLAQLNQWFRRHATRTQRLYFLNHYLDYRDRFGTISRCARNWQADRRKLLADLDRRATMHAERLWGKRDRRSHRNGRYFLRFSPARHWSALALQRCKHPRFGAPLSDVVLDRLFWQDHLGDPSEIGSGDRVTVLKDSHTAIVYRDVFQAGDSELPVIIKQPRPRNWLKRAALWLGHSRNERTWRIANKLIHRDLPTAHPLALIERRSAGLFRTDSILITEAVDNAGDLEAFLSVTVAALPAERQRVVKDRLLRNLIRLIRDFHARGFTHRDFKASNLLVCPPPGGDVLDDPRLVLIDTDGIFHSRMRATCGPPVPVRRSPMWRAVARLSASLAHVRSVTMTDRARLVRGLLRGPGRTDKDWKRTCASLNVKTDRKLRAKTRRRRWKLEHYGRE